MHVSARTTRELNWSSRKGQESCVWISGCSFMLYTLAYTSLCITVSLTLTSVVHQPCMEQCQTSLTVVRLTLQASLRCAEALPSLSGHLTSLQLPLSRETAAPTAAPYAEPSQCQSHPLLGIQPHWLSMPKPMEPPGLLLQVPFSV